ncbi:MAG TPA: response regulator [Nitrososphaeraceae archaeon]|nr:response regulator [Nitrososphaeraceae archaeon]
MDKGNINAKNQNNGSSSVLAVDDEYDIVNLIKQSLERNRQHRVCLFIDALEALNHFKSDSNDYHDVIISDIRMPGMNGYEFVKKAKEIDKQIKVILMSAFEINEREFHNLLPDIKVDAFLQKPFSIQQLNNVVEKTNIKID